MTSDFRVEYAAIDKMISQIEASAQIVQTIKDHLDAIKKDVDKADPTGKAVHQYVSDLTTDVEHILELSVDLQKTLTESSKQIQGADHKSSDRFTN